MEPVKFKKGDRVRCTEGYECSWASIKAGHVGTVVEVSEGCQTIRLDNSESSNNSGPVFWEMSRFKLADPAVCYGKSPVESALGDVQALAKLEKLVLPVDSASRKGIPLCTGVLDYFPAALAEVAKLSKAGNDKHNPGEPMHHARGKSTDHVDCILKHLVDRDGIDPEDGIPHIVKVAWRSLAACQEWLEKNRGYPLARGAKL